MRIAARSLRAALPKPVGLRIGDGDREATIIRTLISPSLLVGLRKTVTYEVEVKTRPTQAVHPFAWGTALPHL